MREIKAYKNSDGYVTEDKDIAEQREDLIERIAELPDDEGFLNRQMLSVAIETTTWSDEDRERAAFFTGTHPSQCKTCRGSGDSEYVCHISGGYGPDPCDGCDGTGEYNETD